MIIRSRHTFYKDQKSINNSKSTKIASTHCPSNEIVDDCLWIVEVVLGMLNLSTGDGGAPAGSCLLNWAKKYINDYMWHKNRHNVTFLNIQ